MREEKITVLHRFNTINSDQRAYCWDSSTADKAEGELGTIRRKKTVCLCGIKAGYSPFQVENHKHRKYNVITTGTR